MKNYEVRIGGLMRCCLASLDEHMLNRATPPKEGDTFQCKYHHEGGNMVFRDGMWEWAGARELDDE